MHRLQEMVRLHRLGESSRAIARQLRMGRDTIRCYLRGLRRAGVLEGDAGDLPEAGVLVALIGEYLEPREPPQQISSVAPWMTDVARLREKGAGPTAIHDWLRLHAPEYDGSLSAVKRLCRRLDLEAGPKPTDVAIPVETAPGEVAQIDFVYAGKRYDPERGVLRKTWLFVMTLGFSRHMCAELVFDQKIATWIELHVHAFEFFGGVPRVIVPDNLKAAVIRAAFGVDDEPVLNRAKRRHGTTGRAPGEHFEEKEREALLPLPAKRWEPVVWKKARLHRDSHVQVDGAVKRHEVFRVSATRSLTDSQLA
jgi:hypothetical protein